MSIYRKEGNQFIPITLFNGKSAYQIALENGFTGTEQEWLESLKATGTSDVFKATFTLSNEVASCSKSFTEVLEALNNNKVVIFEYNGKMHDYYTVPSTGNAITVVFTNANTTNIRIVMFQIQPTKVLIQDSTKALVDIDDTTISADKVWSSQKTSQQIQSIIDESKFIYVTQEVVESVPCTSITLDKTTLSFTTEESQILVATPVPSNTTDSIVWSISPTGIADVVNGVVTPVANGDAIVTAMCGNKIATCNVNVNIASIIPPTPSVVNIFDKDTMIANPAKGIDSFGVYRSDLSQWQACEIPVSANIQYSIKKSSGTGQSKYYSGQCGNVGFLNANKELITSLYLIVQKGITENIMNTYNTDNSQVVALEDCSNYYIDNTNTCINWLIVTTPADCAYLVFNTNLNCTANEIQVEQGDTIHDYYTAFGGGQ